MAIALFHRFMQDFMLLIGTCEKPNRYESQDDHEISPEKFCYANI